MLSDANKRCHTKLDSLYQRLLEHLTALEFEPVSALWQDFETELSTHIAFEQRHIAPLVNKWENNTLKLIQTDHMILERLLPKLARTISDLQTAKQPRRLLVETLDVFIKMRNVLEHHDLRKMEVLYPLLDQQLDTKQRASLAKQMDAAGNTA